VARVFEEEDGTRGGSEWRKGLREAVLACIERYTEFVLELDEVTINGLRKQS
jgi:hypothetical protein